LRSIGLCNCHTNGEIYPYQIFPQKQFEKIDLQALTIKANSLQKQLAKYTVTLKALSMNDM
jgi:hypothetical protein